MSASTELPCPTATFPVRDYDLAATLGGGQAFRWRERDHAWEGVVGRQWVRLQAGADEIIATTGGAGGDWGWLRSYLGLEDDLPGILASFPRDAAMAAATQAVRGLRLLRQDPWESLASFILSSTKQVVQIQECVRLLCARFGEPLPAPAGAGPQFTFPSPQCLADATEAQLRLCKLGFRAKYLRATAQRVCAGDLDLAALRATPTPAARAALMLCPGVGRKVADCVLLFGYHRQDAFPVDVWVLRALRELYFPRRRPPAPRLLRFTETYFGPNAGYAQQYLFHYMRTRARRPVGSGQPATGEIR